MSAYNYYKQDLSCNLAELVIHIAPLLEIFVLDMRATLDKIRDWKKQSRIDTQLKVNRDHKTFLTIIYLVLEFQTSFSCSIVAVSLNKRTFFKVVTRATNQQPAGHILPGGWPFLEYRETTRNPSATLHPTSFKSCLLVLFSPTGTTGFFWVFRRS